ncbi:unnamed protein product [Effrenium voratum]|nr:unnamed protein product [Effrenium voratum]
MEAGDELKAKLAQRAQRSGDASGSQVIDETSARRNSLKESLGELEQSRLVRERIAQFNRPGTTEEREARRPRRPRSVEVAEGVHRRAVRRCKTEKTRKVRIAGAQDDQEAKSKSRALSVDSWLAYRLNEGRISHERDTLKRSETCVGPLGLRGLKS